MYDLIRYTLAIHVLRIGWFESGARDYLSAKGEKKRGREEVFYAGILHRAVAFMQIYGVLT